MELDIKDIQARAKCLYDMHDIESALTKIAIEMKERLDGKKPILLCLVLGGIVPFGNLLPRLDFPLEIDYIHITRYGNAFKGDANLQWKVAPNKDLKDRVVVIIDDILDEGVTLAAAIKYCKERGAKEVLTTVMLEKRKPRIPGGLEKADFVGISIEDVFVFGFGLDYKGYLRNAPGIYIVEG